MAELKSFRSGLRTKQGAAKVGFEDHAVESSYEVKALTRVCKQEGQGWIQVQRDEPHH